MVNLINETNQLKGNEMKNLAIIIFLLSLISCGKQSDIDKLYDKTDDNKTDIVEINKRLDTLYNSLDTLNTQVGDININQDNLTQIVNTTVQSVATLETNTTVKRTIDPCGDNPNQFDEILLELSDGTIIAYFESGSNRYLTTLTDGSYRTTDSQACNFSIVNGVYTK
jgi:hypothetical protein